MSGDQPSDRFRERAEGNRAKLWLLLEADRRVVTAGMLVVVFAGFFGAGSLYPTAENAIRTSDSIDTLFQGFLTATITGVTLVLTLNQLVLSQELGAVEDQRERMAGAMEFREDAAAAVEAPVSPPRPAQFLRALVQVAGGRAADLREAVGGEATLEEADDEFLTAVDELTDSLVENADAVAGDLDDAQFGEFGVVSAALNFNYSWKVFTARRIRETYGDRLSEEADGHLDDLTEVLKLFGPAREHFKTLYFQWELIDLSRAILAAAIPALLVSGAMIAFFNDATYAYTVAGHETLVLVVSAASTVAALPFLILLSYVLRIATVTKHTLSIGPFILRSTDQVEEVEWGR
jgi:hypothetical protein